MAESFFSYSYKEIGRAVPLKWAESSRIEKWAESYGPRCPRPKWFWAEMTRNQPATPFRSISVCFGELLNLIRVTRLSSLQEPAQKCHQNLERKTSQKRKNYFFKISAEMFPQSLLHYFMEMHWLCQRFPCVSCVFRIRQMPRRNDLLCGWGNKGKFAFRREGMAFHIKLRHLRITVISVITQYSSWVTTPWSQQGFCTGTVGLKGQVRIRIVYWWYAKLTVKGGK